MKTYTIVCKNCGKQKERENKQKYKWHKNSFCSKECFATYYDRTVTMPCGHCGSMCQKSNAEYMKSASKLIFCNSSCAAKYNNKIRKKSRRSKAEIKLYDLLTQTFPELKIIPNDKNLLDGYEVDIAIPELKFAIEWNGIVHFKPIYGLTKLNFIQQRDKEKVVKAQEKGIELAIISDIASNPKLIQEAFVQISDRINELRQNDLNVHGVSPLD